MQKPAREQGRNECVGCYALTNARASAKESEYNQCHRAGHQTNERETRRIDLAAPQGEPAKDRIECKRSKSECGQSY